MTVKDDRIYYQMKIIYDDISKDDSEHPVVLVVEWRDKNGDDKSEHIFLEQVGSASRRISRVIGGSGKNALCSTDCKVDGKKLLDGEIRENTQLCVAIRCDEGEVVLEKLTDCDKHDDENNVIRFPDDFS